MNRPFVLLMLCVAAAIPAMWAGAEDLTPQLVKDIPFSPPFNSAPGNLCALGETLIFTQEHPSFGREIWALDRGQETPRLVRDINPGTQGGNYASFEAYGDNMYFRYALPQYPITPSSTGFWRTDGTPEGTVDVSFMSSYELTKAGGYFYFCPQIIHDKLWRSDGTQEGTVKVKNFKKLGFTCITGNLTEFGPLLMFSLCYFSPSHSSDESALWKSDGTESGTVLVKQIHPTDGAAIKSLTVAGGSLFFAAKQAETGYELWKSDGSSDGTALLKDISPGTTSGNPENLFAWNGLLFFSAYTFEDGIELWRSDGTEGGTFLLKNINPGGSFGVFGTGAGYDGLPSGFTPLGDSLFFTAYGGGGNYQLWKTDGTGGGTILVRDGFDKRPAKLTAMNGRLYFIGSRKNDDGELWASDGTAAGTQRVKDIYPGSSSSLPSDLTPVGDTLYFSAVDSSGVKRLWQSDGTEAGTIACRHTPREPDSFTPMDNRAFFTAESTESGNELWATDGTMKGTALVRDINPGMQGSHPDELLADGSTLWFAANDGAHGRELWKSGGTQGTTALVADIRPGKEGSEPRHPSLFGGRLHFTADDGASGREPWTSDGTPEGTAMILDIRPGAEGSGPEGMTAANNLMFFTADDGIHGREVWAGDGTPEGTAMVADIRPGAEGSGPEGMSAANGLLFFTADDGVHGRELWASDGTPGGTAMVADLVAGKSDDGPGQLAVVDTILYFTLSNKLWRSDGTPEGTMPVTDIQYTSIAKLTPAGALLYFEGDDGTTGPELWRSDGTPEGTLLVGNIYPGTTGSSLSNMRNVEGVLFFSAISSEIMGNELWLSQGDTTTTYRTGTINYDNNSNADPGGMCLAGGRVVFTAKKTAMSFNEIWGCPLPAPAAPSNPFAVEISTDSITWVWNDNSANETAFRAWNYTPGEDEPQMTVGNFAPDTTYWTRTGLTANTLHSFQVVARRVYTTAAVSPRTEYTSRHTLAGPPVWGVNVATETALATLRAAGNIYFDNPEGFGLGVQGGSNHRVSAYRYAWDNSAAPVEFTEASPVWNEGILALAATPGAWHLHLQSMNGAAVPGGTLDIGPFLIGGIIPGLAGLTEEEASAALAAAGLAPGTVSHRYDPAIPAGRILSQEPAPGGLVPAGTTVDYVVSDGPEPPPMTAVPYLANMTGDEVLAALSAANLTPGTADRQYHPVIEAGRVISQNPEAGAQAPVGTAVDYVVSAGPEPQNTTVPYLANMTEEEALAALSAANLTPGTTDRQYHPVIEAGRVISQNPEAGAQAPVGTAVDYVVSAGPEPQNATVPDITGMTTAEALAALSGANLTPGTSSRRYHDTVPAGRIISQNPPAGTVTPVGAPVDYTLSAGPETAQDIPVPDLSGMTEEEALAALSGAGLSPGAASRRHHPTIPAGRVLAQIPAAGALAAPGAAVDYVLSSGPEPEPATPPTPQEAAQSLQENLAAADTDGDGQVSFAEASVIIEGLTLDTFKELDANGDDLLSEEEIKQGAEEDTPLGCLGGGNGSDWFVLALSVVGLFLLSQLNRLLALFREEERRTPPDIWEN